MDERQELAERLQGASTTDEFMAILNDYTITRTDDGKANIEKRIAQFLRAKRIDGLAESTLKNYKYNLDLFSRLIWKNVTKISTDDLRQYIVYLIEKRKLKETTLQNQVGIIRSFFAWMLSEEIIKKNPMLKIKSVKPLIKNVRHGLSAEELEHLRNACNDYREKALIEFLVSTGCRISEIVNLNVDEINMRDRCTTVVGKGNKERVVFFSYRAKLMLEEYFSRCKGGIALFPSAIAPYTAVKVRALQKIVRSIGVRAGIARNVHPHLLRHTFAELALKAGMDICVIQELLGHTDISTTQIYAKNCNETIKQQYDKFVA